LLYKMTKIVIHFGALGDVLVSLPAIRAFDRYYPGPLTAIGNRDRLELLIKPWGPISSIQSLDALASARIFGDLDYLPEQFLDRPLLVFGDEGPLADKLRPLSNALLLPAPGRGAESGLVKDSLLAALPAKLRDAGLCGAPLILEERKESSVFTMHPGAGAPEKRWPLARFAELGRRIHERTGWDCQVIFGPAEIERTPAEELHGPFYDSFYSFVEGVSLRALAGILGHSNLHIGNDSGPSHLAAAVATRTLTLFGPSDEKRWRPTGPLGSGAVIKAPLGRFEGLTLDKVWQQVSRLLNR
jgi:hypothetical protein